MRKHSHIHAHRLGTLSAAVLLALGAGTTAVAAGEKGAMSGTKASQEQTTMGGQSPEGTPARRGGPAVGSTRTAESRFHEYDSDSDSYISREEAAGDTGLNERFSDLDRDGDGRLDGAEFERWSSSVAMGGQSPEGVPARRGGPAVGSTRTAENRFQDSDTDRDSYISREEAAGDAGLNERFSDLDVNRDDQLDKDEYAVYYREVLLLEPTGTGFTTHDRDGDGYISRDDIGENTALEERFNSLDSNGDGRLDEGEFAAFEPDSASSAPHGKPTRTKQ